MEIPRRYYGNPFGNSLGIYLMDSFLGILIFVEGIHFSPVNTAKETGEITYRGTAGCSTSQDGARKRQHSTQIADNGDCYYDSSHSVQVAAVSD